MQGEASKDHPVILKKTHNYEVCMYKVKFNACVYSDVLAQIKYMIQYTLFCHSELSYGYLNSFISS